MGDGCQQVAAEGAQSEGLQIPFVAAGVHASSNSQSQPCCAWLLFFRPFLRQQAAAEVPQSEGLEIPCAAAGVLAIKSIAAQCHFVPIPLYVRKSVRQRSGNKKARPSPCFLLRKVRDSNPRFNNPHFFA